MIAHLNGKLVETNPTYCIIECNGVGYFVKISLNTFSTLGKSENVMLFTEFVVREDAQILFGFSNKEEREMFNHLVSVSGIGPNTAILMLSAMVPDEIAAAIVSEDVAVIKSIKGIGLKTAQRVIVDLKDKMSKIEFSENNMFAQGNTNKNEALTALVSLGFDKKSSEKAIGKIAEADDSVEDLIKKALKVL